MSDQGPRDTAQTGEVVGGGGDGQGTKPSQSMKVKGGKSTAPDGTSGGGTGGGTKTPTSMPVRGSGNKKKGS